jgi:hypothetical protein
MYSINRNEIEKLEKILKYDLSSKSFLFDFVVEIMLENLVHCEFDTPNIFNLAFIVIDKLKEYAKENEDAKTKIDKILSSFVENKSELNFVAIILFSSYREDLSEDQILSILEKLAKMEKGMLKINQIVMIDFLNFCSEITEKSFGVFLKFLFMFLMSSECFHI